MKSFIFLLCFVLLSIVSAESEKPFGNFKVYNVYLNTEQHLKQFENLRIKFEIHLLREGTAFLRPYYLTIDSKIQNSFEKSLTDLNLQFELIDEDLQNTLDGRTLSSNTLRTTVQMNWTMYHQLDTINSWVHELANENYFIKKYVVGYTENLRPIYALKISKHRNLKAIVIESNIHAIEWISSAVSTCFLDKLLTTHTDLIDKYDWIFIPIMNPDGFEHSHSSVKNRLWRKNRSWSGHYNESGFCYGTDMNRNFNSHWGESGYNVREPCDHFFGGNTYESEYEVRALIRFIQSFPEGYIRMYLALHAYGQLVLHPYGHANNVYPPNYAEMAELSDAFVTAAERRHGLRYRYGTSGELLGIVSGATKDYFYDYGIPFTATIELRDEGRYGFFLPADQIIPNCEEFTDGMVAMLKAADEIEFFN